MKNADRILVESLNRYAARTGAEVRWLSHDWIGIVSREGKRHLVFGYDLGLNSSAAARIANDKGATFEVLRAAGLPALEHRVFLHPRFLDFVPVDSNWPGMQAAFAEFGGDAVIKDNEGTGGMEVFRVRSLAELEQRAHQLFQIARGLALSPFRIIDAETRFVMLDGECLLAYCKERAANEWRHNLGLGGRAVPLAPTELALQPALALARQAMAALTLRFASIDVVSIEGRPQVLEANAGVMLEAVSGPGIGGPALADSIYHRALDFALAGPRVITQ